MKLVFRMLGMAGALLVAAGARADVVLGGPDSNDGSYSTAALSAAATGGDTVNSGGLTGLAGALVVTAGVKRRRRTTRVQARRAMR